MNCGPAPNFKGVTAWLNTPGGQPLSLSSLRRKVVLVDFWTYSCINCQRSLPHMEGWYAKDGFVVVGVHTPEFAFEHVVSNVRAQAAAGVPDKTPSGELSPETYLGYSELQYLDPPEVARDTPAAYHFPASLPLGALGLAGTWTDHAEEATAGAGAQLELHFLAQDVYLVLGGTGTPRLYPLYQAGSVTAGTLQLRASPGVQAYDFTFG